MNKKQKSQLRKDLESQGKTPDQIDQMVALMELAQDRKENPGVRTGPVQGAVQNDQGEWEKFQIK